MLVQRFGFHKSNSYAVLLRSSEDEFYNYLHMCQTRLFLKTIFLCYDKTRTVTYCK